MCSHLISRRSTPHRLSEAWVIWLEVFLISNQTRVGYHGPNSIPSKSVDPFAHICPLFLYPWAVVKDREHVARIAAKQDRVLFSDEGVHT